MSGANTESTPGDPFSTWFTWLDPLIADQEAAGAASHPTECSILDELKKNSRRTPTCLLNHASSFKKVDEIFRKNPFHLQHLAEEGEAPFFKKESLIKSWPFEESETIPKPHGTKDTLPCYFHDAVIRVGHDLQSNEVYTFKEDPNNSSYVLEIRCRETEKLLRIINDSDARDPRFSCEFQVDETTKMKLHCRPNAPEGQSVSYISVTLPKNGYNKNGHKKQGYKRYLGWHVPQGDSTVGRLRILVSAHSQYFEIRNAGTTNLLTDAGKVNIHLMRLTSGPSIRLAGQTHADGQTSFTLTEGTEEDIDTWGAQFWEEASESTSQ